MAAFRWWWWLFLMSLPNWEIQRTNINFDFFINFFFHVIPCWILFIDDQIAWRRLILCFDAMVHMIVVHVTIVVVIMLTVRTALDDTIGGWTVMIIIVWHEIQCIGMACWCWNGCYIQIGVPIFHVCRIWRFENVTTYFAIKLTTKFKWNQLKKTNPLKIGLWELCNTVFSFQSLNLPNKSGTTHFF